MSDENTNLYDVLGVSRNASEEEIKKAYKNRVKECHPDVGGDENEFKLLEEAYRILSDKNTRLRYDSTGDKDDNYAGIEKVREFACSLLRNVIHQQSERHRIDDPLSAMNTLLKNEFISRCESESKRLSSKLFMFKISSSGHIVKNNDEHNYLADVYESEIKKIEDGIESLHNEREFYRQVEDEIKSFSFSTSDKEIDKEKERQYIHGA